MIDSRIAERIEKLRALAERGVGGEKETAQKKLDKILKENNITLDSLDSEQKYFYLFSYTDEHSSKLLNQIIYKTLGKDETKLYRAKGKRKKTGIYCTPAQKIEIELDYEFYRNLFDEEVKQLLVAFIQQQDLFPQDSPVQHIDLSSLSSEEKERLMKQQAYQNNMYKRTRSKMIEEKS